MINNIKIKSEKRLQIFHFFDHFEGFISSNWARD